MICILPFSRMYRASLLGAALFISAACLPFDGRAAGTDLPPTSITVFTTDLPGELGATVQASGLSIQKVERLDALGADLVHILLEKGVQPKKAVALLNSAFPHAEFELFEDLEMIEAGQ